MKLRMTNDEWNSRTPKRKKPEMAQEEPYSSFEIRHSSFITGFTLIESWILVMALLVIITSIATPAMSRFIRGRALDTEARRVAGADTFWPKAGRCPRACR